VVLCLGCSEEASLLRHQAHRARHHAALILWAACAGALLGFPLASMIMRGQGTDGDGAVLLFTVLLAWVGAGVGAAVPTMARFNSAGWRAWVSAPLMVVVVMFGAPVVYLRTRRERRSAESRLAQITSTAPDSGGLPPSNVLRYGGPSPTTSDQEFRPDQG
jgi:uncharacterized membrane protein YeaQ/YmgE (transglycosylase-associated protein family)